MVGAYWSDYDVGSNRGAAFVYYGSSTIPATATFALYLKYPGTDDSAYAGYSVSQAGDINRDG